LISSLPYVFPYSFENDLNCCEVRKMDDDDDDDDVNNNNNNIIIIHLYLEHHTQYRNLKSEWWRSPLVQEEKCQEEKSCD
jgi:hypothetical protein